MKVPQTTKQVKKLDGDNKNTLWYDDIKARIKLLISLDFFEIHPPKFKPSDNYQPTNLMMIFSVK